MKPVRIGNLEYRTTASLKGDPYEEIVLWFPNPQYKAEEKMKKDGWVFDEEGNAHRDNCHYASGCFKNPECCYTVAMIEWNGAHDEFDVKSVGTRAFDLADGDYEDFKKVLKHIYETIEYND